MVVNSDFLIIASHDGRIEALDARDGSLRWTQSRGHPFVGLALARAENDIVAASGDGYVCAIAGDDGTRRWETVLPIAEPIVGPMGGVRIAANPTLVAVQLGRRMFAINMDNGRIRWECKPSTGTYQWWLLSVGADHVYILQWTPIAPHPVPLPASTEQPSVQKPPKYPYITTALHTWDGTPHWFATEESAVAPPWDGAPSLVEADGIAYASGQRGLHAFVAETGKLLWTSETIPRLRIGALAVGADYVVVAADKHCGIYSRDSGTPHWFETLEPRADGAAEWFDAPLAAGDTVVVFRRMPCRAGFQLEAHESATGALRWVWSPERDGVQADVTWRYRGAGSILYVPSSDDLWGIQVADGGERWHLPYDFDGFKALLAVTPAHGRAPTHTAR